LVAGAFSNRERSTRMAHNISRESLPLPHSPHHSATHVNDLPAVSSPRVRPSLQQAEGHLQTGDDSEAGHPRLCLKTQDQGGAKIDSAGAALGEDALSLPLLPSICLPPSHLIVFLSCFLPVSLSFFLSFFLSLSLLLAPAVGDLRNGAGGELDSRLPSLQLPSFFLSYFLSFFPSFVVSPGRRPPPPATPTCCPAGPWRGDPEARARVWVSRNGGWVGVWGE
jgi:hypothetical protein